MLEQSGSALYCHSPSASSSSSGHSACGAHTASVLIDADAAERRTANWPSMSSRRRRLLRRAARYLALFSLLTAIIAVSQLDIAIKVESDGGRPQRTTARRAAAPANVAAPRPAADGADVLIAVKTSHKFERDRLPLAVHTWYQLAPDKVYFFTDSVAVKAGKADGRSQPLAGHLIATSCPDTHWRQALNCKMNAELDFYYALQPQPSWLCHFDDDNYVNVRALTATLSRYDASEPLYLGKPSTAQPVSLLFRAAHGTSAQSKQFWFATGGAGLCLSRALMRLARPLVAHGRFASVGDNIRLPDDVTLGYIIEHMLGIKLTVIGTFHSHLEPLALIKQADMDKQISFSYGEYPAPNVVNLPETFFSRRDDPLRIRELHCRLYSDRFPQFCKSLTHR